MPSVPIDTVRASREGHQYHEAWLARRALGLLLRRDNLYAIAVEGLSTEDQEGVSAPTIEVADAAFYFGDGASIESCSRMEIEQFKYSIANEDKEIRFSDARKTLVKFSIAEADFTSKHGAEHTSAKLRKFSLITNRPISNDLLQAIRSAAAGTVPQSQGAKEQYEQLCAALPFQGDQLKTFMGRVELVGRAGSLSAIEGNNARTIADWSASGDVLAQARLGELSRLVRNKAGFAGQHDNLITQVDVLAALRVAEEADLLPAPEAFPDPGEVVEREQLNDFVQRVNNANCWIIHAAGGIGKTVFAQSLAKVLSSKDEVVLFDCFGGGAYRSITDARHKPERGLLHIVNDLACRGLCDLILPGSNDPGEVVRRSLQRLRQAIDVLRRAKPAARLILIIDAADNAALEAHDRGQPSFPRELMESFSHGPSPEGLLVIATARTERRSLAIGRAIYEPYELEAFSIAEARAFIAARRKDATNSQMDALYRRADGNPRVLANLIEPDRSLVGETATEDKVELPKLIAQRIGRAVKLASDKGATPEDISSFLCAISVLPPPVPIAEVANAFGIAPTEVESFAADLSPLLDRTRHGIIFRDEPTETLVRQEYGSQLHLLNDVVDRLSAEQSSSIYAARALPGLLFAMRRVERLHKLAFDTRFPAALGSEVAKRSIQLNRLRTAVTAAGQARDFDATVDLLVELSSVVAVDERGEDYLLSHPDLVVGLGDSEALRRLFEAKTGWPGTRHARLAIAYTTDGDTPEAYSHARRADEWLRWLHRQEERTRFDVKAGIEEYTAAPFYLVARGETTQAARYVDWCNDEYGYGVASKLFQFCKVSAALGKLPQLDRTIKAIVRCRRVSPPIIVAALSAFPSMDQPSSARLLSRLARDLSTVTPLRDYALGQAKSDFYQLSLQRSAIRAAHLGLSSEANAILEYVDARRFGFWALRDSHSTDYILPWILASATRAVAEGRMPALFDCLPEELWQLVSEEAPMTPEAEQQDLLERKIQEEPADKSEGDKEQRPSQLSKEDRYHATETLRRRIFPLVFLARQLTSLVCASGEDERKNAVSAFFAAWKDAQTAARSDVYYSNEQRRYLDKLYSAAALHTLTALGLFTGSAATALADWVRQSEHVDPGLCINFITHFASSEDCHEQAGRMAAEAVKSIERENDVPLRSDLFAKLARALLPGNRAEAVLLFARGLSELDAIGSGDYAFTSELLSFASSLPSGGLRPEAALRLAKICELNVYDADKFPWPLVTRAFSRVWGGPCLAQLSRWHDRDKVDLSLTLPAALSFLLRDRLISPEDAVGLLSLVRPVEMQDWGWEHIFESLIAVEPANLPALLHEVLDQFEKAFPERPRTTTLKEIREALEKNPRVFAEVKMRIERLEARAARPQLPETRRREHLDKLAHDEVETGRSESEREREIEGAVVNIDPLSATSIELLIDQLDELDGALNVKSRAFGILRSKVRYSDQHEHIEAIASARNLRLFAKTELIKEIKDEWLASSPSRLAMLKGIGLRIARAHAAELTSDEWGLTRDLDELAELAGDPREELVFALIEAVGSRELTATATAWMNLACILAARAHPQVPVRALERLLDSGAARLADEVGDGPWRPELDVGNDPLDVAAGLVWFCLGSPESTTRWRAAHTVRNFARLGRWEIIGRLFDRLEAIDAGPFQDRKLPFFLLHARQGFLLAVARLSIDYPTEIARYAASLEAVALNDSFPHVGIREAARRSLLACLASRRTEWARALRKRLRQLHKSPFRRAAKARVSFDLHWDRPDGVPEPEPAFHFDYDFGKYEITNLGEMFGLPKWDVEDRCVKWIRTWNATVESMYDFGGRPHPSGHYGYYSGTQDSYHSYGTYLAQHALALTGGQLLLERAVSSHSYKDDPWADWLSDYSPTRQDGLWLADGTGRYPDYVLSDLLTTEEQGTPTADIGLIWSLAAGRTTKRIGDRLVVYGHWQSPDRVTVSITSVLVPRQETDTAAFALATSPVFDMWLPVLEQYEEEEGDIWRRREDMAPCEPWITTENAETRIDKWDPYGSRAAVTRSRPSRNIIKAFKLTPQEPWSELWSDRSREVLFSRAWGCQTGSGEREVWDQGIALECEPAFLTEVLKTLKRNLLLLIKLRNYREKGRHEESRGSGGEFTHSFVVAVIDHTLQIRLVRPSKSQSAAIRVLPDHVRHNFRVRFDALRRIAKRRRVKRRTRAPKKRPNA